MAKGANAAADNEAEDTGTNEGGVQFEDGQSYSFNMAETEEDSGFAPLPQGVYLSTLETCTFGLSKSSQQPIWTLTWAVAEGEFAEKNRKIFDVISLQEKMRGRVKQFINRVAPELATLENFDPKKVADEGLLIGKQARISVTIEDDPTYGPRNRVKDRFAPSSSGTSAGGQAGSFSMG